MSKHEPIEIERDSLYALVWQVPRTELAKKFLISDVAIGKHCRKANIPMPPPGYWAKKQSGKRLPIPELPLRLPGQSRILALGADSYHFHRAHEEDLDEEIHPPVFPEDEKAVVDAAIAWLGKVVACRSLDDPHPGLRKILSSEESRRGKQQEYGSFYKPYFDAPHFQRQLLIINSLFHAFQRIGCSGYSYIMDEWVQGYGTLHFIHTTLLIGDVGIAIDFLDPNNPRAVKQSRWAQAATLRMGSWHHEEPDAGWVDTPGHRLEKQLTSIAASALTRAERRLRTEAEEKYQRRVHRRLEIVEAKAQAIRDAETKRLQEIQVRQEKARQTLLKLAADFRDARDIRELVSAMKNHPEKELDQGVTLTGWIAHAQALADSLDPLCKPLAKITGGIEV